MKSNMKIQQYSYKNKNSPPGIVFGGIFCNCNNVCLSVVFYRT